MVLLIDAGNTRIKWAIVDDHQPTPLGAWSHSGSLSHQELSNPPWRALDVKRVVASNVAGATLQSQLNQSFSTSAVEWITSQSEKAGIRNHYQEPTKLGSDRFASLIAGRALFPNQALIIATSGTALTIDALTIDGNFIGGMIAPGLQLMAQSLAQNTAQLPTVSEPIALPTHFANHTEAAIMRGCLAAQAGAIEHAARAFAEIMEMEPLCIVSGGAAKYITPYLSIPYKLVDNLVLIGLHVISC